jgi:hypothetical protein
MITMTDADLLAQARWLDELARYPTAVLDAAVHAIDAAKAAGDISDHGYGEPIGSTGRFRTGHAVTNPRFNRVEVATSLLFLAGGPVEILPKVMRSCHSTSYGWKHDAEHWGRRMGFSPYVSNGAFIVAAEWLGIPSIRYIGVPNIVYALKFLRDVQNERFDFGAGEWERQRASRVSAAQALRKIVRY